MEKRERKALLISLREGAPERDDPIGYLAEIAGSRDRALARAACAGLVRHEDPRALCRLAERLLNPYCVGVIRHVIEILGRSTPDGCLVVLSSVFFLDGRFLVEKFKALEAALESEDDVVTLSHLAFLRRNDELFSSPRHSLELFETMRLVPNRDMTAGVVFGSAFRGIWGDYQDGLPLPVREEYVRAEEYVRTRVPGLVKVFHERLDVR